MNQPISMDRVFLNRIYAIIEANLENEWFGVEELARELGMNRSTINRKLKSVYRDSVSQLIREYRLQKAMEMLQQNVATVSEIAFRVGFSSPAYFNKCFNEHFGFPPGEVKKMDLHNPEKSGTSTVNGQISEKRRIPVTGEKESGRKKFLLHLGIPALILIAALFLIVYFVYPVLNGHSGLATSSRDAEKSIAVLPFKNLSQDPSQEYISNGMTEEILSHLFMIGGLTITSGATTARYKESTMRVRDIARELRVNYVLVGSVSIAGDQLRIITRLVSGKNEQLLWTEEYPREMTARNMHDIQSDVAQQVAENMHVVVIPEVKERIEKRPTENTEAYSIFLRTKDWELTLEQSERLLKKAIQLDPGYADAYGVLAYMNLWGLREIDTSSRQQILDKVEPLVDKALQLDKSSFYTVRTYIELKLIYYWDFKTVEEQYQNFRRLFPSNPDFHYIFTEYLIATERFNEAYYLNKDSFRENDFSVDQWIFMALSAYFYGRHEEAKATIDKALQELPKYDAELEKIAMRLMIYLSKYKEVIKLFEDNPGNINLDRVYTPILGYAGIAYFHTGNKQKADIILDKLISKSKKSPFKYGTYEAALIYASTGRSNQALQTLEIACKYQDPSLFFLKVDPFFVTLHGNPRFEALLHKVGFN